MLARIAYHGWENCYRLSNSVAIMPLPPHRPQPDKLQPTSAAILWPYTDSALIELETLGPPVTLEAGASLAHAEQWFLLRDVPLPRDDDEIDRHILPRIKELPA